MISRPRTRMSKWGWLCVVCCAKGLSKEECHSFMIFLKMQPALILRFLKRLLWQNTNLWFKETCVGGGILDTFPFHWILTAANSILLPSGSKRISESADSVSHFFHECALLTSRKIDDQDTWVQKFVARNNHVKSRSDTTTYKCILSFVWDLLLERCREEYLWRDPNV